MGWGTCVNPWLIHVNVWQKSLQYCKVISLQLIKINEKKISGILLKQCYKGHLYFLKVRLKKEMGSKQKSPSMLRIKRKKAEIYSRYSERKKVMSGNQGNRRRRRMDQFQV